MSRGTFLTFLKGAGPVVVIGVPVLLIVAYLGFRVVSPPPPKPTQAPNPTGTLPPEQRADPIVPPTGPVVALTSPPPVPVVKPPVATTPIPKAPVPKIPAVKVPPHFMLRVFSRGQELSNGQSFDELDPKLGELERNAIQWELRAQAPPGGDALSILGPEAKLTWYTDGMDMGPIELTKEHLSGRHKYPQQPNPGAWEVRLQRPPHPDVVLFRFTIIPKPKRQEPRVP